MLTVAPPFRAGGGLSVLPNLFTIQWEANKHKSDQLEFLVPWYDLQCGIHFTRFLSTFASTDLLLRLAHIPSHGLASCFLNVKFHSSPFLHADP